MTKSLARLSEPDQSERNPKFHVLIIGAGIGGLSLAVLLAQAGHRVSAIERKASFDTLSSGGGLNVTANAICCLQLMGIGETLQQISDRVTQIMVKRYATGEEIGTSRTTRPHVMLHRHDLQVVLCERALELGVDVRFDTRVASVDYTQASPVVHLRDRTILGADMVVGTDGVNSPARKSLFPKLDVAASPTADCVFLFDIPETVMKSFDTTKTLCDLPPYQIWLGPGRSVVAWYMMARKTYHLQMCEHEYHQGQAYGGSAGGEAYVTRFENMALFRQRWADFDESIRTIISNAQSCTKWRIATAPPLPTWSGHDGRLILLGDAAHAFPPFAGQGAAMAIEDAACLATLFGYARSIGDMSEVGRVFEEVRRPRIDKIHQIVLANVGVFSLHDGEKQVARDKGLGGGANAKQVQEPAKDAAEWGQGIGKWGTSQRRQYTEDYDAAEEARRGWRLRGTNL